MTLEQHDTFTFNINDKEHFTIAYSTVDDVGYSVPSVFFIPNKYKSMLPECVKRTRVLHQTCNEHSDHVQKWLRIHSVYVLRPCNFIVLSNSTVEEKCTKC
ncbi:hypothetical protein OAV62_01360 [bacterium]|nr:hypothetical protein [bacterium]